MVLPAQGGVSRPPAALDDEIRFWLTERGGATDWVFPERLRRSLQSAPALRDIRIDALAVSSFHGAEVKRIGDPLFGDLRRLGALVDARYALLPVMAAYVEETGRVEIGSALIDTMGGNVLWFGVVAGDAGTVDDPAAVASAAQALARTLVR